MKAGKEKRPKSVTAISIIITIYGVYLERLRDMVPYLMEFDRPA